MSQTQLFPLTDKDSLIKTRHSVCESKSQNDSILSKSETYSWSDVNNIKAKDFPSAIDTGCVNSHGSLIEELDSEDYYKKYEHDEVPVRDSRYISSDLLEDNDVLLKGKEITNSELDKLEIRVFKDMSRELQSEGSSTNTDDYNMKIFKSTVQEILDKFYSNVQDFELYKKRFDDILSKNKENLIEEMEDFIKEMIQHINSSESCTSNQSTDNKVLSMNAVGTGYSADESRTFSHDTWERQISKQKTIEEYKNENYLTDSTFDDKSTKVTEKEVCKIYLLNGNPCIEIKMEGRDLLSEIDIRTHHPEVLDKYASAENVKSVTAKKLQVTNYIKQAERQRSEKVIPVKISYAKNNIHTEECSDNLDDGKKSFLFNICSYLCKKLRKTSFG